MTILELKKLIDEYCQQHGVSLEVALYMLKITGEEGDERDAR